jgi:hypothetical protein
VLTLFESALTRPALLLIASMTLLSSCESTTGSATSDAICRELRMDLPTFSRQDTPETLASGARFVAVFEAVCP